MPVVYLGAIPGNRWSAWELRQRRKEAHRGGVRERVTTGAAAIPGSGVPLVNGIDDAGVYTVPLWGKEASQHLSVSSLCLQEDCAGADALCAPASQRGSPQAGGDSPRTAADTLFIVPSLKT